MNFHKSLILLCGSVCLGVVCAVSGGSGVSEEKKTSDLLRMFRRPETAHHMMHTLQAGRQLAEGSSFQLFTKSSKAKSGKADSSKGGKAFAKSAKAHSKGQKEDACSDVQAELDAYKAAATEPQWLFVQMADECTSYRDSDGVFHLESRKFHKDTERFSDRPLRYENTTSTSGWFENFNKLFDDGDGMPNAALTIVDDDMSKDVVISVFAEGYIKDEEGDAPTYGYKLEQSTDQQSVMSLEELMNGEGATFDHCSMFIDVIPCLHCHNGGF